MEIQNLRIENFHLHPSDFTQDEINEVSQYFQNAVGFSQVLNQLYPLTENIIDKAKIFVTIYRLINSAFNYTENKILKDKLYYILTELQPLHKKIYLLLYQPNSEFNLVKSATTKQLIELYMEVDNEFRANIIVDLFILFAEKQIKYNLDKIGGINLEAPEGKEVYKELMGARESED